MPTISKVIQSRLHNRPPEEIPADAQSELRTRLERDYADMLQRSLDLEVGLTQLSEEITTENEGRITDFLAKQLNPFLRSVKVAHDHENNTYLSLSRVVHDFFNAGMQRRLSASAASVNTRMASFRAQQREIARQAQLEEKRQAEEAFRVAREKAMRERLAAQETAPLDRSGAREHLQEAKRAEAEAVEAARILNAPPDPGHVHGDYGATGYLRDTWGIEIEDITLVPWHYITVDLKRVQDDIAVAVRECKRTKREPPGISIRGLRIFPIPKFIAKG